MDKNQPLLWNQRRRRRSRALVAGLVVALMPLLLAAVPDPSAEELDYNRRQVAYYRRSHPDYLAKLRQQGQAFMDLPETRREQILQLDHDLHKQPTAAQQRLLGVLNRYDDWLEQLPPADRQRIEQAPDRKIKLTVIQELRNRDWMAQQPKTLRQEYEKLSGPARDDYVKKLRQQERQRTQEWLIAARFWNDLQSRKEMPARLADLPGDAQAYFNDYLKYTLTKEEKERLDKAQGKWPQYPLVFVELADKHPPALPGADGPRTFNQLPPAAQNKFKVNPKVLVKTFKGAEGNWPGFAQAVVHLALERNIVLPGELWPYDSSCLSKETLEFEKKLAKILTEDEKIQLNQARRKWPDYPQTLDSLARNHGWRVPWQTLPGPRERWDPYRLGRKEE